MRKGESAHCSVENGGNDRLQYPKCMRSIAEGLIGAAILGGGGALIVGGIAALLFALKK